MADLPNDEQQTPQHSRENKTILPLQYIKGVGPKRAEVLASIGIRTATDVVFTIPRSYIHRHSSLTIKALQQRLQFPDTVSQQDRESIFILRNEVTLVGTLTGLRENSFGKNRSMLIATFTDGSGATANIVYWSMINYFKKSLQLDTLYAISGKPDLDKYNKVTFSHPEVERIEEDDCELYKNGSILPKYSLTQAMVNAGITTKLMRSIVSNVLTSNQIQIEEVLPNTVCTANNFLPRIQALQGIHFPTTLDHLKESMRRMKFEEIFYFELMLAIRSKGTKLKEKAPIIKAPAPMARALMESLPFNLTSAQKKVLNEIAHDIQADAPMNRLLQGDVGSGKTIVALLSMLMAVDNGYQTLLLAPTEILAEQHYQNIKRLLVNVPVTIVQIMGGQTAKTRRQLAEQIQSGSANIIIGTHALFGGSSKKATTTSWLQYNKVGLVVIDEQHRFGVLQRAKLKEMAVQSHSLTSPLAPHILAMSATPIPRTLSMTVYGDLDISVIDALPENRKPIQTKVVFESSLQATYDFIREHVVNGQQAYIVYPLVEESEKIELKAATIEFEILQQEVFPDLRLGLLHGQMLWYEKEDAMKAFAAREFDILVATTVVEVGVDIPNASVMLVQHAERFGLAQLHQLRGRVGRGATQSYCFLATKDHFAYHLKKKEIEQQEKLSALIRLRTMEETTDGFIIAEVDLKLRGPGDVMGTRQSGLPEFVFTDLVNDTPIVEHARHTAFAIIEDDPHLRKTDNHRVRTEYNTRYTGDGKFSYVDIA